MTLGPNRALVLSAALHAVIAAALTAVLVGGPARAVPGRVEARFEAPAALEEPAPPPPPEPPPEVREPVEDPSSALRDGSKTVELVDPRFAEDAREDAVTGTIGVGGGLPRGMGTCRRIRAARAPAVERSGPPFAADAATGGRTRAEEQSRRALPLAGFCPGPDYPPRERRLGVEGVAEVHAEVDGSGAVASAGVARSSGSASLDRAAVEAVLRWRFEPALREGVPVPDSVRVRVRFELVTASLAPKEEE